MFTNILVPEKQNINEENGYNNSNSLLYAAKARLEKKMMKQAIKNKQ